MHTCYRLGDKYTAQTVFSKGCAFSRQPPALLLEGLPQLQTTVPQAQSPDQPASGNHASRA